MQSLKLNALNAQTMSSLRGKGGEQHEDQDDKPANVCTCSCYYAGSGGSSSFQNGVANNGIGNGGHSPVGDNACTITGPF